MTSSISAVIHAVMSRQEIFAKALLVDRPALLTAQAAGDALGAKRVLVDAYTNNVSAALSQLRPKPGRRRCGQLDLIRP